MTHRCYWCSNCCWSGFRACTFCCYCSRVVCNALGCVGWHGTLCTSGWCVCHEYGRAWSPCPCAQGGSSYCWICCIATTVITELVFPASTMMTTTIVIVGSSVWPVALALISEMAHLMRILLLQLLAHLAPCFHLNFWADGVGGFHHSHESCGLTGSTPRGSVASCCITCAQITRTPRDQTCGRSCRTITLVAAR